MGGAPFLYADTFMQRDEFGKMFDLALYDKVRLERRLLFYNDINVCVRACARACVCNLTM